MHRLILRPVLKSFASLRKLIISTTVMSTLWLRVIQINDVYELDNLPHLATLVREHQGGPDKVLVCCAGDFLAPYLLSSLDHGVGMVDCLNRVGCTHVCIGNHEADIKMSELKKRIKQSKFCWVNTNMRELDDKLEVETKEYDLIELKSSDGTLRKSIAVLGLNTDEKGLFRPGAFGGVTIEPIVESTKAFVKKHKDKIDMFLPLTHQGMDDQDRQFAKRFGNAKAMPVVVGGHDHEPFDETHNDCRILKTGQNADKAAIIDIRWSAGSDPPEVKARLIDTSDFAPDEEVMKRVKAHLKLVKELEKAQLFAISDWMGPSITNCFPDKNDLPFSTRHNRLEPSLGSTALTTMLRMGMRCQVCLMNAGGLRGDKEYEKDDWFTFKNLKEEMPFATNMVASMIPGHVLEATITNSRKRAKMRVPAESGGYIHACNNVRYNDEYQRIESILGEAFDPNRKYLTALPSLFLQGIDDHAPLMEWAEKNNINHELLEEASIPCKMIMVEVFSSLIWLQLGSFDEIDVDSDGILTREEVRRQVAKHYGDDVADLVVGSIMDIADMNGDGSITPLEMMIVRFAATDLINHVCDEDELKVMKEIAADTLGKDAEHKDVKAMVAQLQGILDISGDGKLERSEVMKAAGKLKTKDMLV